MRLLFNLILFIVVAIALATAALVASGNRYILTAVVRTYVAGHTTANINDHRVFDTRVVSGSRPEPWPSRSDALDAVPTALRQSLTENKTAAFLVVQNGTVIAEFYANGYSASSKTNSFSVAKTVVTMLLGAAIEDGLINSLDQRITDFLPEFESDPVGVNTTIGTLTAMNSGYEWDEHYYNVTSPTVELLYGEDSETFVLSGAFSSAPGQTFYYSSASTQLLTVLLTRALKKNDPNYNLSRYLSEKLWHPLGMNDSALWHLDESGLEHGYCCINTNARNFAKLGQLMLQQGRWEEQQLLPAAYVATMTSPQAKDFYGLSTWLSLDKDTPYYAMDGHLGQYVIVIPSRELVVVRLGERAPGGKKNQGSKQFYVDQALRLADALER